MKAWIRYCLELKKKRIIHGYMCWINKKPCNKNNCTLKHKFAKEFSKKVVKNIKAGE